MPAGSGFYSTVLEHEQQRNLAASHSRASDRARDRRHRHSRGSDGRADQHRNPRTDDAYVSANVIGIAPHVQGPLVQLNVVDNQPVEEGDLLFVVDPRPYEAELQRARGELILAQAEVGGIEQAIAAARAEVARLRADTAYARTHAGRLEPLLGGRFISADQYQEAVTKVRSLDAAVQHA